MSVAARDHQDREVGKLGDDPLGKRDAALATERHVTEDGVIRVGRELEPCCPGIGDGVDVVAISVQEATEQVPDRRLVVHDENATSLRAHTINSALWFIR